MTSVKPVIQQDDPRLREVSTPVTEFDQSLQDLLKDMFLVAISKQGLGLAAVQIGVTKRVIIVQEAKGFLVMVNPEYIRKGNRYVTMPEGCLSIQGYRANISRPAKCELKWQDLNGDWRTGNFSGDTSRRIQHEMDHLDGILITDLPRS